MRSQQETLPIGELTQEETKGIHSKSLAEVLERKRRGRAGSKEGNAAQMNHGLSGGYAREPLSAGSS